MMLPRAYGAADWQRDFQRADAASVPIAAMPTQARGVLLAADNEEPEPGDLTQAEVDAIAADLDYNRLKQSGELGRRDEMRALTEQVYRTNLLEHLR